jgi:hypothetical protein
MKTGEIFNNGLKLLQRYSINRVAAHMHVKDAAASSGTQDTFERTGVPDAPPPTNNALKEKEALISRMIINDTATGDNPVDEKKVVTILASLFSDEMIKAAIKHGVTVNILDERPAARRPCDLGFPCHTFDGRDWSRVAGGYNPGSNALYIKGDTMRNESSYNRNVLIHEFSHAVDDSMRNHTDRRTAREWIRGIHSHYEAARKKERGHRFIDGYAAHDEAEYFAQEMTAYAMEYSGPLDPTNDDSEYYFADNVNRRNLLDKDRTMFNFIRKFQNHDPGRGLKDFFCSFISRGHVSRGTE